MLRMGSTKCIEQDALHQMNMILSINAKNKNKISGLNNINENISKYFIAGRHFKVY